MTFKDFLNYFLLHEDSIENIELKGDWDSSKQYGWNKADTGILKSPNYLFVMLGVNLLECGENHFQKKTKQT
jgi:hypothetical protein